MTALQQLRKELAAEEARLAKLPAMQRIARLKAAIAALVGQTNQAPRPKRKLSAETLAKLRAAGKKGARAAKAKAAQTKSSE